MLKLVPADTNPRDDIRLAQRPDSDEQPDPSGFYPPDAIGPERA